MKKVSVTRAAALVTSMALIAGLGACANTDTKSEPTTTTTTAQAKSGLPAGFDLQAHRGGRGENTEESAAAFRHALGIGVTTLEFDIVMTKDGIPVVWHDPKVQEDKCRDTHPLTAEDPMYPYVGKLIHQLTWAQLQTLRCDKKLADFPAQKPAKDNRMLQLKDVFAITKSFRATDKVYYNIETKVEAEHRDWSADPQVFVDAIMREVRDAGVEDRVMIQSFDWRTFPIMQQVAPSVPLVMLWDETTWEPGSPWTGNVNYQSVKGDIIKAAKQLDVQVLSPGYTNPYGLLPGQKNYKLVADKAFIDRAHKEGLQVVPWTINNSEVMSQQIDAGADGIITDYPSMLRDVMYKKGMELPEPLAAPQKTPVTINEKKPE